MRIFLIKLFRIIFLTTVVFLISLLSISSLLKNSIDPFYIKLLGKTDNALILGDSRALQGIDPTYLPFMAENFAFTIGHSPYDKSYLKLIKKKVDTSTKVIGRHIVCVSPWSLVKIETDSNDINPFFSENLKLPLCNPNIEYLFKYTDLRFVSLLKLLRSNSISNNLGWLKIEMSEIELRKEYKRRVREKINNYKVKYDNHNLDSSTARIENLKAIIQFLKKTGNVCLVRLPVSNEMLELEKMYFTEFDNLLIEISKTFNLDYINLTDLEIQTTDGNHIWYKEVPKVTKELAKRL
jgi:hypothetical protein